MASRFNIELSAADVEPILGLAPPTLELYEELCRAAVERALSFQKQVVAPRFADGAARLLGTYPETELELHGTLDDAPASWRFELYRPAFYRMRRGRFESPAAWSDRLEGLFAEPLGWLVPGSDGALATACQELMAMGYWFGDGITPVRARVMGDQRSRTATMSLKTDVGDELVVDAPWSDGAGTRRLSEVAIG